MTPLPAQISIVDSIDDNSLSYVIVDGCKVPVKKVKIGDYCYVMKLVKNFCIVDLAIEECEQ